MQFTVILTCLVALAASTPTITAVPLGDVIEAPRIINGRPAQKGQFPWQVFNEITTIVGTGICGGTLISSRWVLTAAHCAERVSLFTITLGSLYSGYPKEEGALIIKTNKSVIHEDYDNHFLFNDIALVDLQQNVKFSDVIQPISLSTEVIGINVEVIVSGWGKVNDEESVVSPMLNYVEIHSMSNEDCDQYYGAQVTEGTLCCRGNRNQSSCHGDTGGPLVKVDGNGGASLVGVISFVHISGCGKGYPSAYTRIAYQRDWILQNSNNLQ